MSKTYHKNDELINSKVGETFSIELEGNPTTGYQWQEKFDEEKVKLLDKKINPSSGQIGASATEVFKFQVLKEGTTDLRFNYKRAWESENLETLEIKVKAQKD